VAKAHVKKGDTVLVIAGKDKGKKGKVIEVLPQANRVVVEDINIVKKHTRPDRKLKQGGIIEQAAPLNLSNVQLICPKCDKAVTTGHKLLNDGKKVRVCKKCGEFIDR